MVSSQHHVPTPPQLPENPSTAELPDPAHLLWLLDGQRTGVLNTLQHNDNRRIQRNTKTDEDTMQEEQKNLRKMGRPTEARQ